MADTETNETQTKWFCHSCNSEIVPDLTEFQCSNCGSGFIEAIESEAETDTTSISFQNAEFQPVNHHNHHHHHHHHHHNHPPTHTHHHENRPPFTDSPFSFNFSLPFGGGRNVANFIPPPPPPLFDGFHGFVEQLLFGLMGGVNNQQQQQQFPPATFSFQFGTNLFNGNTGDYVFSAEGLDNIVTMLMNQLEGTGPPPASREQVDALPVISITQAHVDDKLQCHVCMENFQLDEKVKELPCRHIYHQDCIVPWLELHGTCPVCRKRIESTNPSTERFNSGDDRT